MGAPLGAPVGSQHCKLLRIMVIGERGFEPPTPWSRKRDSGVVLNVFNLLQWCFDHLSPAESPHSGTNVSPRMAVPARRLIKDRPTLRGTFRQVVTHLP